MENSFFYEYDDFDNTLTLNNARQSDIDNFSFNFDIDYLLILGDYFDKLIIPDGVKWVCANNLGLKEVHIPESVECIYIENNFLSSLHLPKNIEKVCADNNLLVKITCDKKPTNLWCLEVQGNKLRSIDFEVPETIEILKIRNNPLLKNERIEKILKSLDQSFY